MFQIITSYREPPCEFERIRYFIDCPVQIEMFPNECRRIEIPTELAKYIKGLQRENDDLKFQIARLSR